MSNYTNSKRDIVKKMRSKLPNLTMKEIENVINVFTDTIKDELELGNSIVIPKFGKFEIKEVEKQKHYNPLTEEYEDRVVAYKRVTFKSSKIIRNRLNKKDTE